MRNSSGTILGGQKWSPVKIGGLGFVTGGDISADGTLEVCRTDVGGAYRRESTADGWTQIITTASMTLPAYPSTLSLGDNDFGVYEIAIAPSAAATVYLAFRGRMLKSTDRGVTFADDSLNGTTGLYMTVNTGFNRITQHKLKVDPGNPAVAYLGTQNNGLWQRLTAGWAQIASVPVTTETDDGYKTTIVAIDPTSATTGSSPNVRKTKVYASVNAKGVYESTDGGTTFALMSGHPGAGAGYRASHMVCDQNGKLWLCLDNGATSNLWTWNGTAWTQNTGTGLPAYNISTVEVDPKDATRVVGTCVYAKPFISTNGGTSWSGAYEPSDNTTVPNNCVIAYQASNNLFLNGQDNSVANILPHPTLTKDRVWEGWGTFFINSPWPSIAPKALVWHEDTKGIEELVSYHVDIHPDGTTFCSAGDRGLVVQDKNGNFATVNFPTSVSLTDATNVDYAIDNLAYKVQQTHRSGLADTSGFSSDGGKTWTAFPAQPNSGSGGHIAISSTNQIVSFRSTNVWPKYSHDGGTTWNDCIFAGFTRIVDGTENGWGFGSPFSYRRHIVCADKANPGTFYAYNYGPTSDPTQKGIWKSTDGGVNWVKVGDPGTNNFGWHVGLFMTNGHLYIFTGPLSSDYTDDGSLPSYRSENGGVTWTPLSTIDEVNCLSWGKAKPNSAIPYALYALGWIGGVFGLYRSDDKGATWVPMTNNNSFDWPRCLAADPSEFDRLVVGYTGTGFAECIYNYQLLLKGA